MGRLGGRPEWFARRVTSSRLQERRTWQLIDFSDAEKVGKSARVASMLRFTAPELAAALHSGSLVTVAAACDVRGQGGGGTVDCICSH